MFPVLFTLGSVSFFTYGILTSLGFLTAVYLCIKRAFAKKAPLEFISDHFLSLAFWSIISARLAFAVANWSAYSQNLFSILALWQKGYTIWGGIVGFLLAFSLHAFKQKENLKKWIDILIPTAIIGLIFENLASLLDGSRYGSPTELPWGVTFESLEVPFTIPVHPIQLYVIIIMLTALFVTSQLEKKQKMNKTGVKGIMLLFIVSLSYYGVNFLNGSESMFFAGMSFSQIIQLGVAILSAVILASFHLQHQTPQLQDHEIEEH
jgi:phosphatidylglycerol---prolipoprotein diacylglyceryl transferase